MESKEAKIKGTIASLVGLGVSLDAMAFFVFHAIYDISALIPSLLIASYFLFEAAGRVYAFSYTLANRRATGEDAEKAKARLAFAMGIVETFYPIAWIFAIFTFSNAVFSHVPLLVVLFKISAEVALSIVKFLPYRKKKITMASESMCSVCVCCSFFVGLLVFYLASKGTIDKNLAETISGVSFIALFFVQNAFFSILLLQGQSINKIKKMVSFGLKHGLGNYIVVTSCLMTVLTSGISAYKEGNLAYLGIAVIYLTLGAARLSALLWKNAIHRNVYNERLAEASENKILLYVGALLCGLSVLFAFGIFWISKQELKASATFVLVIQVVHGLFRMFLCIKSYVSYQKRNQPFSIAVSSLDMLIGVYSLFSLFMLINIYLKLSWIEVLIDILAWATFAGAVALGVIMIWLGLRGYRIAKRMAKKAKNNSDDLEKAIRSHGLIEASLNEEGYEELKKDQEFERCLHELNCLGPSSEEEKRLLEMREAQEKEVKNP